MKKKNSQENKQKKNKTQTEVERYVDKALDYVGIGGKKQRHWDDGIALNVGFDECPYELSDAHNINSIVKKMSEVSVYNSIKNNKRFKAAIDKLIGQMTSELIADTARASNQIERDNIANEKYRKKEEARAKKQKEQFEKKSENLKKENAQRNIFNEGLTAEQKKAFKKFYKVDIDKYKGKSLPKIDDDYDDWDDWG